MNSTTTTRDEARNLVAQFSWVDPLYLSSAVYEEIESSLDDLRARLHKSLPLKAYYEDADDPEFCLVSQDAFEDPMKRLSDMLCVIKNPPDMWPDTKKYASLCRRVHHWLLSNQ